jgi:hydrogenase expression/formation protein HypE
MAKATVIMMDRIIRLAHGAGGSLSQKLHEFIVHRLGNQDVSKLTDSAVLSIPDNLADLKPRILPLAKQRMAFTTDGYVVKPRRFPGGDIGKLAICGTINDLAVMGAVPFYISVSLIIEEGMEFEELALYLDSAAKTANEASVLIVTGDTKVVDKGSADGLFVTTSGIGFISEGVDISPCNAGSGQKIIINGTIGDHSIAVISAREGLSFAGQVESDCAPLNKLINSVLVAVPERVKVMRDPTRGGVASTLNEIASASNVDITVFEEKLPVSLKVQGACSLLGYDLLHLANEGKCVFFVEDIENSVDKVISVLQKFELGRDAAIIGEVTRETPKDRKPRVVMKTAIGGTRIVDVLSGDLLPRIC